MVTTREAAPAVRLNADWQAKYRQRAHQFLLETQDALQKPSLHVNGCLPSVCVVGRSGVGKSSLINHLLQEKAAVISRLDSGSYREEQTFNYHGLLSIKEIPGYDGWHAPEPSRRERFRQHFHRTSHDSSHSSNGSGSGSSNGSGGSSNYSSHSFGDWSSSSSHSSKHGSSHGKGRQLNLDEFVEQYKVFKADTKAIIFVVNSRITPDDEKLLQLAVERRKFFCIVCTHADHLVKVSDEALRKHQLEEKEEQIRKDLSLLQNLNVRVFFLSIPYSEGPDLQCVMENVQELHFPLLQAYLSQPCGLLDELQIHSFVKEEVWNVLEPYMNVKKRQQALDFTQHLVAGTLLPILGPVMVSFLKTLWFVLKACSEVGLIEDADAAIEKVNIEAKKHGMSAKIATKEGLMTGVHDSMIHIFGPIVFEVAIVELVSTAAEATFTGALPLVGPVISAASLPGRAKKIGEKLAGKTCMLHELWIMQNITGLLGKVD
ncbi:hypothetical protein L7F22_029929 [Adiantum nelumboides]|nr:hypothetical protein [Adiantum nelumboides]